jgi:butyryl-CoA dehydrogenase
MKGLIQMTDQQSDLVAMVHDFMNKEVKPYIREFENQGCYPDRLIQMGKDMGLTVMQVPEAYGGLGLDTTTTAMMIEEGSRVESTFMSMFNITNMGAKIVMKVGTEAQKKYYAGLLADGAMASFCLTEAGTGSDAASVRTTAVRKGNQYIINGTKMFITNGGIANVYLVVASVDPGKGYKGLATFIVERNRPGVSVGKKEDKLGMCLSNTTEIIFEDVAIPAANLVGTEESGFRNAMKVLEVSRPLVAASSVGSARQAVELAVKYSKERVQFGKPICKFQAIQLMLADMEMRTNAARALVYNATRLIDEGKSCAKEAAMAKCYAADAYQKNATDAVQIFGGYGVMKDYLIEKLYRDSKVTQIVEGTNQIQRFVIAKEMIRESK